MARFKALGKYVEIGGRNLLLDSKTEKSVIINSSVTSGNPLFTINLAEEPIAGLPYTLTIWADIPDNLANMGVKNTNGGTVLVDYRKPSTCSRNEDGSYSLSLLWKDPTNGEESNHIDICSGSGNSGTGTFTLHKIKLEKGYISTDWSPAPEDLTQ